MKGRSTLAVILCAALTFSAAAVTPVIKTQPASTTVSAAATARFSVVSTNTSPLTYQWQFKGTNITDATNSTLVVDNVQTNQAGAYTVAVTSPTATVKSAAATLKVMVGTLVRFHVTGAPGDGNMDVRLFDYDKPATVENFVNYIRTGQAYSNMFFGRLIPGHVLQAGDYFAADKTSTQSFFVTQTNIDVVQTNIGGVNTSLTNTTFETNILIGDIYGYWVDLLRFTPPLPLAIANEFGRGAKVSNEYGTIAMGQVGGDPNSAASSFYFNLTNNNSGTTWNLDVEYTLSNSVVVPIPNVGYTTFGRVVSGTNVLEYFNTLTKTNASTNGAIFDLSNFAPDASSLTDLPIRQSIPAFPANADLYFVDLSFLNTPPPVDTTLPGLVVQYPLPNSQAHGTLENPRTLTFYGTASDNVGVARIFVEVLPFTGDLGLGNDAEGTTNWTITIPGVEVGTNEFIVFSQDGRGNINKKIYLFDVTTPLFVHTNGYGTVTPGRDKTFLKSGTVYNITATPKAGNLFSNWNFGNQVITAPSFNFYMSEGTTITANFMTNSLPGGITFTYPAANAGVTNGNFTLTGKIKAGVTLTNVTLLLYYNSGLVVSNTASISATTWSKDMQLNPGVYNVTAIASDVNGKKTLITETFTVLTPLHIIKIGQGTLTPDLNGKYLAINQTYSVTAKPASAQWLFATWSDGSNFSTNPVATFGMYSNLTLTATFVPNYFPNIAGTYNGLFYNTNTATAASSGAFSITPTATGGFSGKLMSLGKTFTFSGKFDYTGNAQVSVARAGTNAVTLFLSIDLTNGTGVVSGTATNANWTASLLGYRAVTKLNLNTVALGSFVMDIPGTASSTTNPPGSSYTTFTTTAAGALTLTGKLADNLATAIVSQSTGLSTNGLWPFFVSLANGTEVIFGWQTFTATNHSTGTLQWIKGASAVATYYPSGFITSPVANATKLTPPQAAVYNLIFEGGTLTSQVVNTISVSASHVVTVLNSPADKLTFTYTAATGAFTGTFINPVTSAKLSFYGTFSGSQSSGGFFLDQNHQSGSVSIVSPP